MCVHIRYLPRKQIAKLLSEWVLQGKKSAAQKIIEKYLQIQGGDFASIYPHFLPLCAKTVNKFV